LLDSKHFSDQAKKSKQAFFYALNIKAQLASLLKREFLTSYVCHIFFLTWILNAASEFGDF